MKKATISQNRRETKEQLKEPSSLIMLQPLVEEPDAKHAKNAPSSLDPMMQSMSLAPFQEIKKMTNDHSNQQQDLHLLQQTGDGMPKDKQSLCIDILVNGHVNSFVDFFYLTHRSDEESNNNRSNFPDEQLQFIKNNVTIAEKAHRRGNSESVYESYEKLAGYFQEIKDFKTSIYFYEKCLDIAESMDDLAQQGNSNLNLGLTHDAMGDTATAIQFHERHLQLATEMDDDDRLRAANHQLVEAYRRFAEEFEKKDATNSAAMAVTYYKKMLHAAADAGDVRSEGLATYRLGVACANLGDKQQSVSYQQDYLDICKRIGDQLGEGAACAALAHSFREMGNTNLSIRYLEKYLDIATHNSQSVAQAEACAALGSIYSSQGDHDKAVTYFEKTFEIARAVGDRKLVDSARINLGMARGNMGMNGYMNIVNNDLDALLKWKTRRMVAFK